MLKLDIVECESPGHVPTIRKTECHRKTEKVVLKTDDKVTFRHSDSDKWKEVTVL